MVSHILKLTYKDKNRYVKRTCNFGYFHGSMILTENINEAKTFTRIRDVERKIHAVHAHTRYHPEKIKRYFNDENMNVNEIDIDIVTSVLF